MSRDVSALPSTAANSVTFKICSGAAGTSPLCTGTRPTCTIAAGGLTFVERPAQHWGYLVSAVTFASGTLVSVELELLDDQLQSAANEL